MCLAHVCTAVVYNRHLQAMSIVVYKEHAAGFLGAPGEFQLCPATLSDRYHGSNVFVSWWYQLQNSERGGRRAPSEIVCPELLRVQFPRSLSPPLSLSLQVGVCRWLSLGHKSPQVSPTAFFLGSLSSEMRGYVLFLPPLSTRAVSSLLCKPGITHEHRRTL